MFVVIGFDGLLLDYSTKQNHVLYEYHRCEGHDLQGCYYCWCDISASKYETARPLEKWMTLFIRPHCSRIGLSFVVIVVTGTPCANHLHSITISSYCCIPVSLPFFRRTRINGSTNRYLSLRDKEQVCQSWLPMKCLGVSYAEGWKPAREIIRRGISKLLSSNFFLNACNPFEV